MKKNLKIVLGFLCGVSILVSVFYASKENPRVYLSDRINLAYVNEDIDHKNFENVIDLLNKADFNIDDKVKKGLKIADIDPRKSEYNNCFTISDKSRSLGNAVLMAMLYLINRDSN